VKLLLTSGGVTNASLRDALVDLLGKPVEDSAALFIPTAQWGQPLCSPESVWRSTADRWEHDGGLVGLGWRSVGVLELTALPSIDPERWQGWVRGADALLVDGGEAVFLAHWMRRSGLVDLVPELADTVWLGVSAGSMVMTPRVGRLFVDWQPDGTDETLGLVDFAIFPHLDYPGWSGNTSDSARRWAAGIGLPSYAIDEQSAVVVTDGDARVVSEGSWLHFDETGALIDQSAPPAAG
jgi:dipeptidase E